MIFHDVYIGIGGNIGDTAALIHSALSHIKAIESVRDLEVSAFYETSPVSDIPQSNYVNAVCRLKTSLDPIILFNQLQHIANMHTKLSKTILKNAPRELDLDILLYGTLHIDTPFLNIPHPRWQERLFVLIPLSDLTSTVAVPIEGKIKDIHLPDLIRSLQYTDQEVVALKVKD